jgi:hypothetical protein
MSTTKLDVAVVFEEFGVAVQIDNTIDVVSHGSFRATLLSHLNDVMTTFGPNDTKPSITRMYLTCDNQQDQHLDPQIDYDASILKGKTQLIVEMNDARAFRF